MFYQYYLFCYFMANVHWASATVVAFANTRFPEPSAFQVFYSARDPDVCCEPLDIDIHDDRGYGWFRADLVAFSHIEDPNIFTTVFGRRTRRQCSSDLIATKQGSPNWQIEVPEVAGGAGSAAIVKSSSPGSLKLKYPNVIVVGDVRYNFYLEDTSGVLTYMDQAQNKVTGRPFVNPISHSDRTRANER